MSGEEVREAIRETVFTAAMGGIDRDRMPSTWAVAGEVADAVMRRPEVAAVVSDAALLAQVRQAWRNEEFVITQDGRGDREILAWRRISALLGEQ